jgi:hypothetical protein
MAEELRRVYGNIVGVGIIVAITAALVETYGIAAIATYSGYLSAFTYLRIVERPAH